MKPLLLLLVGVAAAMTAQFGMDVLADENALAHWVQHGLLFWGGLAVGTALVMLYRRGQLRAE